MNNDHVPHYSPRHAAPAHAPVPLTARDTEGGLISINGMLMEEVLQLVREHHIPLDARFSTHSDLGAVIAWGDGHRLAGDYLPQA